MATLKAETTTESDTNEFISPSIPSSTVSKTAIFERSSLSNDNNDDAKRLLSRSFAFVDASLEGE